MFKNRSGAQRAAIRSSTRRRLLASIEPLEMRQFLSGTWTTLTNAAPGAVTTMMLLPDGSVIAPTDGDGAGSDWARLTPNASGSYVNGTWTRLANSNDSRLFDSSVVMQNGNVFLAGGEYGNGTATAESYNPLTNTWTRLPGQSFGNFSDAYATLIANGDVLDFPVGPSSSGHTTLYNPNTNTWSQGPAYVRGGSSDEQGWVKLADGSLLTVDSSSTSERYIPSTNSFVNDGAVPVTLSDSLGEYGPSFLLPSGRAIFFGASGHSAIYSPTGTSSPGSWVAGPDIPGGLGEDDASGAVLRDGTVLITAGPIDSYNGPTTMYLYDPVANSFSLFSGPNTYGGAPFLTRMVALPNGDILYSENGSTLYQYDPGTTALVASVPTITTIVPNSNGSLTLTGTNLNGVNVGADYGDDAQMDSNYPIIRLTSGSNVYYARSYNWTNTGVQLGATSESVTFTLPLGIPAGTYSVVTVANGVPSTATSLTISTTSGNVAPTVATAAAVTPTAATGTTAALSVLGADDAGESNLIYTWTNTSAPSGTSLASFSINGTNAAKNSTATFHHAGSYSFKVTITDAGGLSITTSIVTVNVTQTLTSIGVTPTPVNLTTGQSQQLSATGYDQFGNSMSPQPTFTWAVTSGAGTVSTSGLYTTPATGTLATVNASTGSFVASSTIGVVNSPWISTDIGSVNQPGIGYDSAGTTTLTNTGSDIWNTSDQFHFDYQSFTGDGSITAKIVSQTSASTYIKAGVMFRNTLADNSVLAMMCDPAPGPLFEWRTAVGTNAAQTATSGPTAPYWVRLVRAGSTFTGYSSPDGVTWTMIGSQTITMNNTVYVGLADCSHDSSHLATAVFSNVSLSATQVLTSVKVSPTLVNLTAGQTQQLNATAYDQNGNPMITQPTFTWALASGGGGVSSAGLYTSPATGTLATVTATTGALSASATIGVVKSPWKSADIGAPGIAGIAYDSGTTTTVNGSGDDIWNAADSFHFDYQTIAGNSGIIAEINAIPTVNTDATSSFAAKAGVMFRDSTASSASFVDLVYTNSIGLQLLYRNGSQTIAAQAGNNIVLTGPIYVKLLRVGSIYTGYYSTDGATWSTIGSYLNTSVGNSALVGVVACSHDNTKLATVTYSNVLISQPSVAIAASANPSTAVTSTNLTVLGANSPNPSGEASLTYTWAATTIPAGAPTPVFSINGTSAAKHVVASSLMPGTYVFTVTIADALGQSVTSAVTVTAAPTTYTGGAGADTYAIRLSPTNSTMEQIFVNTPESGTPTYTLPISQLTTLTFSPTAGDGTLTIDFANGNPLPSGGVNYTGGPNPTTTGNVLYVAGTSAGLLGFSINGSQLTYTGAPASPITYSSLQRVELDLLGGANTLNQTAQPGAPLIYNAGSAVNTLNVGGGTFTFGADPRLGSGSLTVNDSSVVVFSAGAAGSGFNLLRLGALNLTGFGAATLNNSADRSDRSLLVTGSLSLSSNALLNLNGNDLDVTNGNLAALSARIGQQISSASANSDPGNLTSLGILSNNNAGQKLYGTGTSLGLFDGYNATLNDALIKYTYLGDADLTGQVDASDYSRIDNGFLNNLTGWSNGDFNYDGVVNGSDYTLIDNAFNTQGASLAAAIAAPAAAVAVPPLFSGTPISISSTSTGDSIDDLLTSTRRHKHGGLLPFARSTLE